MQICVLACLLARLPFLGIINAHPKLSRPRLHAAANHEAVTWLEDMQGARHGGVRHGTHKDRHILRQTAKKQRNSLDPFSHLEPSSDESKTETLTQKALWSPLGDFLSSLRTPDPNTV